MLLPCRQQDDQRRDCTSHQVSDTWILPFLLFPYPAFLFLLINDFLVLLFRKLKSAKRNCCFCRYAEYEFYKGTFITQSTVLPTRFLIFIVMLFNVPAFQTTFNQSHAQKSWNVYFICSSIDKQEHTNWGEQHLKSNLHTILKMKGHAA